MEIICGVFGSIIFLVLIFYLQWILTKIKLIYGISIPFFVFFYLSGYVFFEEKISNFRIADIYFSIHIITIIYIAAYIIMIRKLSKKNIKNK